uniref:Uncharacterized protein LOC100181989 n=1 Tax=Phallusia mammillata TaxID=59560 RepID=A0A6F9DHS5_9ASCI|nr:uncharacterized protein LOC100181989 [Phallusia mammillata]
MSSYSKPEVALEDLINCVHIGKTLTTELSRHPPEAPVTAGAYWTSNEDFNPLMMPAGPKVIVDIELDKSADIDNKRIKLEASNEKSLNNSEMQHAVQTDYATISGTSTNKVTNQSKCNNTELKKVKRKRLLANEEVTMLRTPESLDPPRKKPYIYNENSAVDKADEENKAEKRKAPEEVPTAKALWLPPSPDSLSEDEKDTLSECSKPTTSIEIKQNIVKESEYVCTSSAAIASITACNIVIKDICDNNETSSQLSRFQTFNVHSECLNSPQEETKDTVEDKHACNISKSEVPDEVSRTTENEHCGSPPAKRSLRSRQKNIRKTLPPLQVRQTPMGLPKPLRLKKDKFSIEEIYTNKNYSTPVPKSWETIFEYPKQEKDGTIRYVEKRRKTRAMVFYTNPAERPSKKRVRTVLHTLLHEKQICAYIFLLQRKRQGRRIPTRRNKMENDLQTNKKLQMALAELDEQLELHNLS